MRVVRDPVFVLVLRACLALLLASAALHKWRDLFGFRSALADYDLLPQWVLAVTGPAIAVTETGLAVTLMLPGVAPLAAIGAAALLCLYASAIGINLRRGRVHIDCGCSAWGQRRRLSVGLVWRNVFLVGVAVAASLPNDERVLNWVDAMTIVAAVTAAALLYRALDVLVTRHEWLNFAELSDA